MDGLDSLQRPIPSRYSTMKLDKARIQKTLTETVLTLCQTEIPFDAELNVEGLLGITLDKDNVILVNIKEVIRHDMPKDYSTKGSEKRKAQADAGATNKRQKEGPRKMPPHSFVPEGYASQEDSQDGNPSSSSGASSLKIPLIPPEYVHAASQIAQIRQKQVTDMRQKHSEISRMLAVSNLPHCESPRSSAGSEILRYSPDVAQLQDAHNNSDGKNLPQSAINLAQDYIPPSRPVGSFGPPIELPSPVPINLEHRPDRPSSGMSPLVMPTDLSVHSSSPRNTGQMIFPGDMPLPMPTAFAQPPRSLATSQPIGVVLDTNVQPPAPLAVVAGTGVLQAVSSMGPKHAHDFLHDLPEGTAVVQPVEIVPDEDIRMSSKSNSAKKERNNSTSKKEKAVLQMGRPKKSKEFCRFRCTICNAASSRKFNLQRHVNSHHPNATNCIVDLTPPKNPRQIRVKGQSDMKFHTFDSSMYGMVTPEGVSMDSVMDLSISPSPDKMMMLNDDDGDLTDTTEDTTPPPRSVVGGTGITTMVDDIEHATMQINNPVNTQRSPSKSTTADVQNSPDAKKRFAKNKRSLDNMLLNKFGKYHNFSEDGAETGRASAEIAGDTSAQSGEFGDAHEQSGEVSDEHAQSSDVENAHAQTGDADEAAADEPTKAAAKNAESNEVELVFDVGNRGEVLTTRDETQGVGSEPTEATNIADDDSLPMDDSENNQTPEKRMTEGDRCDADNHKRRSDASDCIETDANANNKNDMVVEQAKFSPDVNGNSKSTKPVLAGQSDDTEESTSMKETMVPGIACGELNDVPTVETDNQEKFSDIEAMRDYADNADDQSNDLDSTRDQRSAIQEQSEEAVGNAFDGKKMKSSVGKDATRVTRRSVNSNPETELEEGQESKDNTMKSATPLSPRKLASGKAALREPIKTRTATRTSSITTRRSSMREEIDAK